MIWEHLEIIVLAIAFLFATTLVREIILGLILPSFTMNQGDRGNSRPLKMIISRIFLKLLRHSFDLKKDIFWVLQLSLLTYQVALLGFLGKPIENFERPFEAYVVIAIISVLLMMISGRFLKETRHEMDIVGYSEAQGVDILCLFLILSMVAMGAGTNRFEEVLEKPLWFLADPFGYLGFLLALCLHRFLIIERKGYGWGLERLTANFSETSQLTLLASIFLGTWSTSVELRIVEMMVKVVGLDLLISTFRLAVPKYSLQRTKEIKTKFFLPMSIALLLSLWWRYILR